MLVHFWADWCGRCKEMDAQVFSQPQVAAMLESQFVPVKLNRDYFQHTAEQYNVFVLPCDIVITPQGQLVERIVGVFDPSNYAARLNRVAARTTHSALAGVAQVPPMEPTGGQDPARGFEPGVAGYERGSQIPPGPVAGAEGGYASRSGPPQQPDSSLIGPRYSSDRPAAPLGGHVASIGGPSQVPPPDLSGQFQTPPVLTPGSAALQGRNGRPDVSPPGAASPRVGQSSSAAQAPTAWSPGSTAQVPAGNPPLGLDGHCPVQLTENERWVLGDPRWGLIWLGRTYLFAGPSERDRFDAAPERYAPVLSGNDVVLAVEEGRMVSGRREHGAWLESRHGARVEKRVYLFSGEDTYRAFRAAPDRYVNALPQLARSMSLRPPEVGPVNRGPGSVPVEATLGPPQGARY